MGFLKDKKRLITVGGTVVCALAIGVIMQNVMLAQSSPADKAEAVSRNDFQPLDTPEGATPSPAIATAAAGVPIPGLADPIDPASDPVVMAALDDLEPAQQADPAVVASEECAPTATGVAAAGAVVTLDVTAPCLPNERFVVHHNGMMFSAVTDDTGAAQLDVPALSQTAVIIAEFANGEGAVVMTEVPSLGFYDRVVLQWSGDAGFQLHAREFGARYGATGHVWSGASRDATAAALGDGGFVTRLGVVDGLSPRIAEVYTFPSATASRSGDIALSVEAEITAANCGNDIEAQSLELRADGTIRSQYLTLAVADCDAIGDFLVLNNLVNDLKIAAN